MVKPHTHPPGRPRNGRRPPRGPRTVPLSSRDQERVAQLKQAAEHCRQTGAPELGDAVDFVLSDEGANFIGRLRWKEAAEENPNLALSMPLSLREEIKEGVKAAGKNLPTQAAMALNAFLDGKFVPDRLERAARGSGGPRANLNVRVNAELRRLADEYGRQLKADGVLDWEPKTSDVLKAWFVVRFTARSKTSKK